MDIHRGDARHAETSAELAGARAAHPIPLSAGSITLLLIVAIFLLAPLWLVRFPPLQDYPNHLACAYVLAHLTSRHPFLREFYSTNWRFYPNLTTTLILMCLQALLPVEVAGKIVLSLCLLSIPIAGWLFLNEANPGEESLAFWPLLMSYDVFFLWGYMNYSLSIAVAFVVLAIWLKWLKNPRILLWLSLLFLMTALYFTHFGGVAVVGFVMTALLIAQRRPLRIFGMSWGLFVPSAVCYLTVAARWGSPATLRFGSLREKTLSLITPVLTYSLALDILTALAIVAFFGALWLRNAEFHWRPDWLWAVGSLFAFYWICPESWGAQGQIGRRLLPFIFVLALAAFRAGRRGRLIFPLVVALFLVRSVNMARVFATEQENLSDLARSIDFIPVGARVLPLVESWRDPNSLQAYPHFWAYGVIHRSWFCPYLFSRKDIDVLRIRLRSYAPEGFHKGRYATPPDWREIAMDYQYVWAYDAPEYDMQLKSIGSLVFQTGELCVYRLGTGGGAAARPAAANSSDRQLFKHPLNSLGPRFAMNHGYRTD